MTLSLWCTLQNVIQTQKCGPCQLNKLTTPFPARGFPPDTASTTCPKAQAWLQFKRHALDNNGWAQRHTQDTTDEFSVIPRTGSMPLINLGRKWTLNWWWWWWTIHYFCISFQSKNQDENFVWGLFSDPTSVRNRGVCWSDPGKLWVMSPFHVFEMKLILA